MENPDTSCVNCGHLWGITEESCPECGFDPVGNDADGDRNEDARAAYEDWLEATK